MFVRFGEESLHSCEVMIKDIEDSKRFNTAVHNASKVFIAVERYCTFANLIPLGWKIKNG